MPPSGASSLMISLFPFTLTPDAVLAAPVRTALAPTIPPVPTPAPSPIGSPVAGREYPAALREQFMQSCIASAKTDPAKAEGYCTCAMKKIEERFTIEEFVQLSLEMASSGKVPDKLLPVITDCISFLL